MITLEKVKFAWLSKVGKPAGFYKVDVKPVNDRHFRANLWIRNENGPRIVKSSFVTVTDQDEIIFN